MVWPIEIMRYFVSEGWQSDGNKIMIYFVSEG